RELARPVANEAAGKAIDAASKAMQKYATKRLLHQDALARDPNSAAPEPLDLEKLATDVGLTYFPPVEINQFNAEDSALGRSFQVNRQTFQFVPFIALGFGDRTPVYMPIQSMGRGDVTNPGAFVSFCSRKIEETESYVPELADVREEVIQAVKDQQAQKLAAAAAKEMVEKLNKPGADLKAMVSEEKQVLITTDVGPFAQIQMMGGGFTTSEVRELNQVGQEFMTSVFDSSENTWTSAPNDPKSVYYVVKPTTFTPSTEELQNRFKDTRQRQMAMNLAAGTVGQLQRQALQDHLEQMGFETVDEEDAE
ncbi:MAG: hypothetical protein AAFP90_11840, partial [Planctomycetota bacterium]